MRRAFVAFASRTSARRAAADESERAFAFFTIRRSMSACGAAAASSAWSRMSTTATSVFESARERERGRSAALVFFFDERTVAVRTTDFRKSDLAIAFHLFEGIGIEVGCLSSAQAAWR